MREKTADCNFAETKRGVTSSDKAESDVDDMFSMVPVMEPGAKLGNN